MKHILCLVLTSHTFLSTAGSDYETGQYTLYFTAGQMNATLMVSTMDDGITELSEDFKVMIDSTDQPSVVEIGPSNVSFITITDNDPGMCTQSSGPVHPFSILCVSNECG